MKVAPHAQDGLGVTNTPQSARRQLSCACWAFWKPKKLLEGHTKPVLGPSKGSHLNTAGGLAKTAWLSREVVGERKAKFVTGQYMPDLANCRTEVFCVLATLSICDNIADINRLRHYGLMRNVLFVCSQNRLRSPTAQQVFASHPAINVASAGTNNDAEYSSRCLCL